MSGPRKDILESFLGNIFIYKPNLTIVEIEASLGRHKDGVGRLITFDPRQWGHQGSLELNSSRHVGDPKKKKKITLGFM